MTDLIDRQAAIDATWKTPSYTDPLNVLTEVRDRIAALPSAQGDAEFINWLLDEVWDEEMWELNYRAFPELLCRRLVRLGYLKEEGGKYVRLDK